MLKIINVKNVREAAKKAGPLEKRTSIKARKKNSKKMWPLSSRGGGVKH